MFAGNRIVERENIVTLLLLDENEVGVIGRATRFLRLSHSFEMKGDFVNRIAIRNGKCLRSNDVSGWCDGWCTSIGRGARHGTGDRFAGQNENHRVRGVKNKLKNIFHRRLISDFLLLQIPNDEVTGLSRRGKQTVVAHRRA